MKRDDFDNQEEADAYYRRAQSAPAAATPFVAPSLPASDPNSAESLSALNQSLGFGDFDIRTGLNADGTQVVGPNGDPSHHTPVTAHETPAPPPAPTGGGGGGDLGAPGKTFVNTGQTAVTPPPATTITPPSTSTGPSGPSPEQTKADALYEYLMGKAKQSTTIDPNDPTIRAQSDTYSANLTRTGRRYLSELAERKGSGGNISAESRMLNEKNAQASAEHEGGLMQHELDSRRAEIQQALALGSQFMTAQQQMSLQRELATIDNNIKMYQSQVQQDQFGRTLGQNQTQFGSTLDLQNRTLTQQGDLARLGFAQSAGQFGSTMSQRQKEFEDSMLQRSYEYDTDDAFRRSAYAQK